MTLPAAPRHVVDGAGRPAFGRHAGQAASFDWGALAAPYRRSAWWRRFHHKRWHYVSLACDDVFCAVAIVDLGWASTAFAYVFDRRERRIIAAFSQDGLPGLSANVAAHAGADSCFRFFSSHVTLGPHALALRCGQFALDAQFAGAGPLLLAVGAVDGGSVHATQKSPGMALHGQVRIGARCISLDGGVASIDYSNGLLARQTSWRWACGHSLALGFNLQAGYFGANENALWLDGKIIPLAAARFDFTPDAPMAPWHVCTDDGLLDLQFAPEGVRQENKNLLLAASRYMQPIGSFSGWVRAAPGSTKVVVKQLAGVTEDHWARW